MDARKLYEMRTQPGIIGWAVRLLVFIYTRVRPPHPYPGRNQQFRVFGDYLQGRGDILLLGSNLSRGVCNEFGNSRVVQVDIKPMENVDVVANAEELTTVFPDNSFDYVVATSMLEHTSRPWQVVSEVFKVLKPSGIFYASVPWIFPLHGEPEDYWRFSMPCLRNLIKEAGFDEVASGSEASGFGALYTFLKAFLSEAFSFNNSVMYYSLEYVLSWLLFPLGFMERVFRLRFRTHYYTDSLLFIIAKKPG